ncbi:Peptidase family C25 [uncultured archaeon]|nr:Peptidase family C25 [uncultured archaeon]
MDFSNELQPLVTHKEQHDIVTRIVTLDDIYGGIYFSAQGRDDAEKIKYFIKNAKEQWNISYVMLVGGKEELPVRYAVYYDNSSREYSTVPLLHQLFSPLYSVESTGVITDLYYADIYDKNGSFCSWDSNQNGFFGEVTPSGAIDDVDLYPDVGIGRLLCHSSEEVTVVVNKIINYENTAYGSEWFHNLVLCGGDTHPYTWQEILIGLAVQNLTGLSYHIAFEGEYMSELVAILLNNFTAKKYYASSLFGIKTNRLTAKNMNLAINDGAGLVMFNFHGAPTSIATHPPFNNKRWMPMSFPSGYNISNVQKLTNGDKLPVIVFSACSCGDFDTIPNPIAWEFVNKKNGGAIASFALTTMGDILPSTACTETMTGHTTMSIFEAYREGIHSIGDLWAQSIIRYLNDDWAWKINENLLKNVLLNYLALEEWILFGDPTLEIGGYSS